MIICIIFQAKIFNDKSLRIIFSSVYYFCIRVHVSEREEGERERERAKKILTVKTRTHSQRTSIVNNEITVFTFHNNNN